MMRRGDIHYIVDTGYAVGSEQRSGRPAIIVSNDANNLNSPVVEIVYLTTRPKTDMPTHVSIRSTPAVSIALCEQITSVSVERIGDFMAKCTNLEMEAIDRALEISLDLKPKPKFSAVPATNKESDELKEQLAKAIQERDMYKNMYDGLINTLIRRS